MPPLPPRPGLFGAGQPMSQVGGRAPTPRPMGPAASPSPQGRGAMAGGGPPRGQINPRQLQAQELMLKSKLLQIQAIKTMIGMGGGAGGRKPRG